MIHKAEKKKKKTVKNPVILTFNAMVATNEDVNVLDFIKNNNEYLAEPKTNDGCIITFKLINCELQKQQIKKKENNNNDLPNISKNISLCKYMHFSFRGTKFTVDTEERTILCNMSGLPSEIANYKNEDGLYSLNVFQ